MVKVVEVSSGNFDSVAEAMYEKLMVYGFSTLSLREFKQLLKIATNHLVRFRVGYLEIISRFYYGNYYIDIIAYYKLRPKQPYATATLKMVEHG